ncbi:hypothetical protein WAI453_009087 [Rhynchosporium graminicola]
MRSLLVLCLVSSIFGMALALICDPGTEDDKGICWKTDRHGDGVGCATRCTAHGYKHGTCELNPGHEAICH